MAELHRTTIENEVMKMEPVPVIEVPARGSVALEPGGYHIMLMGLQTDLNGLKYSQVPRPFPA